MSCSPSALPGLCASVLLAACCGCENGGDDAPDHGVPVATSETTAKEVVLSEEKQKAIWDVEHVTFEVETHVFKRFVDALKARSAGSLLPFFRDGFEATVPVEAEFQTRRQSLVLERKMVRPVSPSAGRSTALGTESFADFMLTRLAEFERIEGGRLRILHMHRLEDAATDPQRWRVELLLALSGVTKSQERISYESHHHAELEFADDPEICAGRIFAHWEFEDETILTCPQRLLEEVTKPYGLADLPIPDNWNLEPKKTEPHRFQVAVADFNGDGFVDIAAATAELALLLQNENGERFVDVTANLLRPGRPYAKTTHVVSWIDYDNDGFPDLLMRDRLFHNRQGQGFEDVTEGSGLGIGQLPMGANVFDYNGDGRLDLYFLYQYRADLGQNGEVVPWVGDDDSGMENQLWRNEGSGRFRNVTSLAKAAGGKRHTFAAACLHYDDDHWPDLYIANDFGNNVLLRNRGDGTFEDISANSGTTGYATSMGVATGDLNNDGAPEIYVANMFSKMGRRIIDHVAADDYPPGIYEQIVGSCAGNRLFIRKPTETLFREISEQVGVNGVGWAYGPAMADFDGDGFLDLYATTGYMSFQRSRPDG